MTKQEILNREKFVQIVQRESNAFTFMERDRLARLLMRHAKTHGNLQEQNCNGCGTWYGESTESFNKRQSRFEAALEKREQQIERRLTEIANQLGFGIILGGDPRGATVKLKVPSGFTDDWAKEGVCVPQ